MQNHHLLFIEDFAETLAGIFKNMAQIMRKHSEKMKEERPELARARNDLVMENRKILELQEIIKQKFKGTETEHKPPEPKKRPLTAFALFLADHRDKILVMHPGLDFHKIATLASYKWKKLSREGQIVYEKKLEEFNKISDEELMKAKRVDSGDANLVKREYEQEQESKRDDEEHEPEQQQDRPKDNEGNLQPMQEQKNNHDNEQSEHNNANQPPQATLLMEPEFDNHATLQMQSQLSSP